MRNHGCILLQRLDLWSAQRILEVSTELHLTWRELEKAVERVKGGAYISAPTGGSGGSGGTVASNASKAIMNVP